MLSVWGIPGIELLSCPHQSSLEQGWPRRPSAGRLLETAGKLGPLPWLRASLREGARQMRDTKSGSVSSQNDCDVGLSATMQAWQVPCRQLLHLGRL